MIVHWQRLLFSLRKLETSGYWLALGRWKTEPFLYETVLDLSQGYSYSIPTTCRKNQKISTTILLWGKYAYLKSPMGVARAPGILFECILMYLFANLDQLLVEIDDKLVTKRVWKKMPEDFKVKTLEAIWGSPSSCREKLNTADNTLPRFDMADHSGEVE